MQFVTLIIISLFLGMVVGYNGGDFFHALLTGLLFVILAEKLGFLENL